MSGLHHWLKLGTLVAILCGVIAIGVAGKGSSGPSKPQASSSSSAVNATPAVHFQSLFSAPGRAARRPEVSQLEQIFFQAYPEDEDTHLGGAYRAAVVTRLGFLKAMKQANLSEPEVQFLKKVAANAREHWLVQRQALNTLHNWLSRAPEGERLAIMGSAHPSAVAFASKSEWEMLTDLPDSRSAREPSSSAAVSSFNSWEALPCPTSEKFLELTDAVNWNRLTAFPQDYSCDLSPQGKMARLLLYFSSLDFSQIRGQIPGEIPQRLEHPFQFFRERVRAVGIDNSQLSTTAYSQVEKKEIHLGQGFFSLSPFEAMATLIHEARHSDRDDPGHVTCVQGNIPGTQGSCDYNFTNIAQGGAYSYGTYFLLLLSRTPGMSPADVEFLRSEALVDVANRFNRLPATLAQFSDGIVGITEDSGLVFFHPFARYSYPVSTMLPAGKKIKSLGYDDRTGGVFLYIDNENPKVWNWGSGTRQYYPELLLREGIRVSYASRLTMPVDGGDYSFSSFIDENKLIKYISFSSNNLNREVRPYPVDIGVVRPKQFCHSRSFRNYLLSEDGALFEVGGFNSHASAIPVDWAGSTKIRQISCGVLHDSFYGVSENGSVVRQAWRFLPIGDPGVVYDQINVPVLEESSLQVSANAGSRPGPRAISYQEGTQFRGVLDEGGSLTLEFYRNPGSRVEIRPFGRNIRDFAIFRLLATFGPLAESATTDRMQLFRDRCGVEAPSLDPWLRKAVGVDSQHRLVFEGKFGDCVPAALPVELQSKVQSFAFIRGAPTELSTKGEEVASKTEYFTPLILEVTLLDGSKREFSPYEGWKNDGQRNLPGEQGIGLLSR